LRLALYLPKVIAGLGLLLAASTATATTTLVTLAFDGAYLDVAPVQEMLSARGLHASFFANSAMVGTPDRLALSTLVALQADGNEVGGGTAYGLDLFTLEPAEQAREICVDRSWLLANGLTVTSFAFPSGIGDPTTSGAVDLVASCGYDAARKSGGLACAQCLDAVPLPPPDPLRLSTLPPIATTTTVAALEDDVTAASGTGGGWLIFVFHHLCDAPSGCDSLSIPSATLAAFLDWLVTQQAQGIAVKTLAEVIGGPVQPAVAPPPATTPSADGGPLLQNASLESNLAGDGIPDCWQEGGEGDNLYVFTRVSDAHDGQFAEQIQISQITSGARRLVSTQDLGQCAPAASVGHRYRLSAWIKSQGLVKLVAYTRGASGAWSYWDQGPDQPASDDYQLAQWITPVVPTGSLGLSVGVTLQSRGTMTMDQLSLEDLGVNPAESCATAPRDGSDGWLPFAALLLLVARRRRQGRNTAGATGD
jgi:MYXO-CTERM domain-containing protein